MKSKFYCTVFIGCFWVMNAIAQKQNVYFLKYNGSYVTIKDSADYIRIVREPDAGTALYNVLDYYLSGNLKMMGKSSNIDPIRLEGQGISYYPNKNKKRVCNYENGILTGDIFDFYPNGKLYYIHSYAKPANKNSHQDFSEIQLIQDVYDSTGVATVKDGTGHYRIYDEHFKEIVEEGDVKNGKRNGTWTGTLNKGKVTFTEDYADGKFIKGTNTNENGQTINYTVNQVLPTFKTGEKGFGQFLSKNIRYPATAKERNIQGSVIIGFTIETDGRLTDFRIMKSVFPDIDAEALRVVKQSPNWNPGMQHGVPVKVAYSLPITFNRIN